MARKRKFRGDMEELSRYERWVVVLMRAGEKLHKQFLGDASGDAYYYLEPSGRAARRDTAWNLQRTRYLAPMGDALFGDRGNSQTWVAK